MSAPGNMGAWHLSDVQQEPGLHFSGSDLQALGLHGLSQEQKEIFRQYSQQVEQAERDAQARFAQHFAYEQGSASGTPTQAGIMAGGQILSPAPTSLGGAPSGSQGAFHAHTSASVPHTPLKPFDSSLSGVGASALSTPSLSLAGPGMGPSPPDAAGVAAALHSNSPMTPRHLLGAADHMLHLMPPSSLLAVHAPPPQSLGGQGPQGPPPPPPPPPPTPSALLGMLPGGGGAASGSAAPGSNAAAAAGQGLTMAFASALAQAAAERGVDPSTLVQLLQSPKLVDVLLSKAGDLQQQQHHHHALHGAQQQMGGPLMQHMQPPPPPPPRPGHLQSRMSAPVPGEWPPHHPGALAPGGGLPPHFRPPPPPPPRPSPAAAAAAAAAAAGGGGSFTGGSLGSATGPPGLAGAGPGGGGGGAANPGAGAAAAAAAAAAAGGGGLDVPGVHQALSGHMVQEFVSARSVLVQLMLSAYAFLNSDSMRGFFKKLGPVAALYDSMHELPVVQKRERCLEMGYLRAQLLAEGDFVQLLQALCALRHHLYTLSRKVLVINQGPDGIPIDLLLGSMSTELYHVLRSVLPQEVSDYFGNCLPHPRLAVLVFAEFTSVDPMPTLA